MRESSAAPTMGAVGFGFDPDRWRRHEMRDYSEGAALENEAEDERPPKETPRDPRWTRPVWFGVLLAVVAFAAWLIWAKDNPFLGVIILVIGGGSSLFVIASARPAR